MGKRDEAEEASGPLSGRAAEFPGIVESWSPFENSSIKTGYGGRLAAGNRVSSDATAGWTKTRPEDTGAGS